jgi:hypothetical protein
MRAASRFRTPTPDKRHTHPVHSANEAMSSRREICAITKRPVRGEALRELEVALSRISYVEEVADKLAIAVCGKSSKGVGMGSQVRARLGPAGDDRLVLGFLQRRR